MKTDRAQLVKESPFWDWLPYAGIGIGAVTGIGKRIVEHSGSSLADFFTSKASSACKQAFARFPILQAINSFKQLEVKYFALATPLLPLACQIAIDAAKDKTHKGLLARVQAAFKKNFTLEQGVYLASFALLGLTGSAYCSGLGMCVKGGFDPSGHMMIKTLCATILAKGSAAIANKENRNVRHAFNALYAITDAVLIHNTVSSCHTLAEAVAGLAWGLGIVSIANYLSKQCKNEKAAEPKSAPSQL
jgi:hypothetical protein